MRVGAQYRAKRYVSLQQPLLSKGRGSYNCLEGVMNLLRNGLLMRKTGDLQRTELTEESASQCGFSAEFITPSSTTAALSTGSLSGLGF